MDLNDESNERDAEPLPAVVRSEGGDPEVLEWAIGLPSDKELIPLSQWLVSPELASAFSIPPPDLKTLLDIHCAAHQTLSNLCSSSSSRLNPASADDEDPKASLPAEDSSSSARMPKRPRLVWTPHLHKRFVDVVSHLGIKNAVPKTIMQLMNVDGLTRENVASHLQKYRLYLKRQGLSDDAPSSSDHLLPHSLQDQQPPLPYAVPTFIPMPVYSMPHHHAHGIVPVNAFHSIPPYEPSDWSGGSKLASAVTYPHVLPNDKYK